MEKINTGSGAVISPDQRYRYRLWRSWRMLDRQQPRLFGDRQEPQDENASCVFIMLNPSTADEKDDDPTIRRCTNFAAGFGFSRLEVVNLFAYRSTDPMVMLRVTPEQDPVGPENRLHIEAAVADAGLIICAWGYFGTHLDQDERVLSWLAHRRSLVHCLGTNQAGTPAHPLYLPGNRLPVPYKGRSECVL